MATPAIKFIRILLIDDHPVLLSGLRLVIESHFGLKIVGEADNRADALTLAERERPDIILLDIALPDADGLELIPELLAITKDSHIIILTGLLEATIYKRAIQLGASGVVHKGKSTDMLIKAIEKVHNGEVWFDRSMMANLLADRLFASNGNDNHPETAKIEMLTRREREVIALVGEGLRNKQIAERLFISEGTVRNHLTIIFGKLQVSDRSELLMYAYRYRLAKPRL